MQQRLTQLVIS